MNPATMNHRTRLICLVLLPFSLLLAACRTSDSGYPVPSTPERAAQPEGYPEPPADSDENGTAADVDADVDPSGMPDLGGRLVVIGTDATYPPFESQEPDGTVVGFDPDLMTLICGEVNCVPEFRATEWDGIFAALAAGEFDAVMSATTILPEREERSNATFSVPYFSIGQVILARIGGPPITDVAALADAVVGVQMGTTGDTAAKDVGGVPEENMRRFDTIALAVQALLNGDVDAVVADEPTAANYAGEHAQTLAIVGEPFTTEDYGILVPNEDPALLHAINAAIEVLQAEGAIARLAEIHDIR